MEAKADGEKKNNNNKKGKKTVKQNSDRLFFISCYSLTTKGGMFCH